MYSSFLRYENVDFLIPLLDGYNGKRFNEVIENNKKIKE